MQAEAVFVPDEATLYDIDFAAWSATQATALAHHHAGELDWENLAEEIGALARSDKRAIGSNLKNLLLHLIKHALQPERRSASWIASIDNAREAIGDIVERSPSLKRYPAEIYDKAMADAYRSALIEMGLTGQRPAFARWTLDQALDPAFLPE